MDKLYTVGKLEVRLNDVNTGEVIEPSTMYFKNGLINVVRFFIDKDGHYALSVVINGDDLYKHAIGAFGQQGDTLTFDLTQVLRNIEHIEI